MSTLPRKLDEDSSMVIEKKGIVTILGTDLQTNKLVSSLRRTLSADMSSTKWLARNGVSPLKRIASSDKIANTIPASSNSSSSSDDEDELDQKPTNLDVSWSSILLSGKTNDDSNNNGPPPPPYIHPLSKKSSTLNEKSLEICTESLGSETGSDGFSCYTPSETSDVEEADKEENVQIQHHENESIEEFPIAKYNYNPFKKSLPRAFPPPLPSIASKDGPSLHMQSRRENGRLVLEAVSVPQRNYFHAERQEGRLVLRLVDNLTSQEPCQEEETEEDEVEIEEVFANFEEVEKNDANLDTEEDDEEEEIAFVMEQSSSLPSNVINIQKSGPMMKRLRRLENNDPTWSNKLNKAINLMETYEVVEDNRLSPFPQSLPPVTTVARLQIHSKSPLPSPPTTTTVAASFNVYEYFWRKQPTEASIIDPITQQCTPLKDNKIVVAKTNTTPKAYEQQDLVVTRGNKAGYLVPLFKGCKDSRRSLLIWEPHCIAT